MTDEKDKLKNIIGKYKGKLLDKEASDWKKYKFTFQVDDKQLNFFGFTPWKKKDGTVKKGIKPEELIEGKFYKLGYKEYQEGEMTHPSKTLLSIWDSDEPKEAQLEGSNVHQIIFPDEETLNQIITMYKQSVDEKVKCANHFVGTVLMTLNEDKLKTLFDKYQEKVA